MTSYRILYDDGMDHYVWTTVRAERYKLRSGTARFYVGRREVAYFYDVQVVIETPGE